MILSAIPTPPKPTQMIPRLWIAHLGFSDGTSVSFAKDDVIVIVGPNNSGKSATLRAIRDKLSGKMQSPFLTDLQVDREGRSEDVISWLTRVARENPPMSQDTQFEGYGTSFPRIHVERTWDSYPHGFQGLTRFF